MSGEPWGYLLPLRDGPPPLELREDIATVGTAPSCTLPLDAATSGLPADAPPQVLFAVRGDASSGHAQLRSQADVVRVNDQPIPRGRKETLQHGARIAFQPDGATYVYVSRKESNSFRAPPQVLEEYFVGHCVGGGGFGNVYALFSKKQRYRRRALKIVEPKNKDVIKYVKRESRIMMDLKHPCIVETFSVEQLGQRHFILMEYMMGGDLEQFLRDRYRRLTENEIKFLFFQLALAVEYLHEKGICHRDLKPSNILLQKYSPNTLIKVTDFGLAKVKNYDSSLTSWAGTKQYLAPEIVREEKSYTNSVDVWSMGIILFYSFTGSVPFENIYQGLLNAHVVKYIPKHWYGVSEEAQNLVKRMLTPQAEDRLSASQVVNDPWLRDGVMHEDAARLPGLQEYLASRGWGGEQQPWGYLLPLLKGPPLLELKLSITTVGTGNNNSLQLDASAIELSTSTVPQNLFTLLRGRSVKDTVLRCESDMVFVNDKEILRSKEEIIHHGVRISFARKKAVYLFVNIKENDSLDLPPDMVKKYFVVPFLNGGGFGSVATLFDKKMKEQRKIMKIVEKREEVKIILTLKYPCIMKILDIFDMNKKMYAIMEYMAGGDLEQLVHDKGPFSENNVKLIFFQVALTVQYLHDKKVCLCNCKPSNVLLQRRHPHTLIKITTFNIEKDGTYCDSKSLVRSNNYLAPELLSTKKMTMSADVWSMGILLYYILTCTLPSGSLLEMLQRRHVVTSNPIEWLGLSSKAQKLVQSMLKVKEDDRVSVMQVMEDPWLRDEAVREDVFKLTGIHISLASSPEKRPPWGYLMPLQDGLPTLEMRQMKVTVGINDSCTLNLNAILAGHPDSTVPQVLCVMSQYITPGNALLKTEFADMYLNGKQLHRGEVTVMEHGARIVIWIATYMFVSQEHNDSFRAPSDFLKENLVGECLDIGGFGNIYILFDRKSNYRRKIMKIVKYKNEMLLREAEREATISMSLKHQCIIEILGIHRHELQHFIVMEFLGGGDLSRFVNEERQLSEAQTKLLFYQLVLGVQFLHQNNIRHGCLRPSNVFMQCCNPHTLVKISGSSILKNVNVDSLETLAGTKIYLAPEMINEERPTKSGDQWSLGVILFYSLTGALPFKTLDEAVRRRHVVEFDPERWSDVSKEAQALVKSTLKAQAADRVSATQVLEDPWLRDDEMREAAFQLTGLKEIRPRPTSRPSAAAPTSNEETSFLFESSQGVLRYIPS